MKQKRYWTIAAACAVLLADHLAGSLAVPVVVHRLAVDHRTAWLTSGECVLMRFLGVSMEVRSATVSMIRATGYWRPGPGRP